MIMVSIRSNKILKLLSPLFSFLTWQPENLTLHKWLVLSVHWPELVQAIHGAGGGME